MILTLPSNKFPRGPRIIHVHYFSQRTTGRRLNIASVTKATTRIICCITATEHSHLPKEHVRGPEVNNKVIICWWFADTDAHCVPEVA